MYKFMQAHPTSLIISASFPPSHKEERKTREEKTLCPKSHTTPPTTQRKQQTIYILLHLILCVDGDGGKVMGNFPKLRLDGDKFR
jgi:hypothetical protein